MIIDKVKFVALWLIILGTVGSIHWVEYNTRVEVWSTEPASVACNNGFNRMSPASIKVDIGSSLHCMVSSTETNQAVEFLIEDITPGTTQLRFDSLASPDEFNAGYPFMRYVGRELAEVK